MFTGNFKIFISGLFFKNLGIGFYSIASMLLVLEISGNVFFSGLTFFLVTLPGCLGFLIAPFSINVNYKKTLIACESLKALLLFTIPIFYFMDILNVFYLMFIMFVIASLAQFTYPIESTLVPTFVGKDNVVKANSILNMLRESLDLLFFGIAGLVVTIFGAAPTILITAFCFIITAAVYSLFRNKDISKDKQIVVPEKRVSINSLIKNYKKDLSEGINLVKSSIIPHIIVASVIANFFTGGMFAALPAFSLLKGGEYYYGFFMVAMTAGLLIGSYIAPKLTGMAYGNASILTAFFSGICFVLASILPSLYSVLFYGIGFIFTSIINIFIFSSIQQSVETSMIGRIITLISSFASISVPLGALLGGLVAFQFGSNYAVLLGGFGMLAYSLYWIMKPALRSLPKISEVDFLG